MVDTVVNGYNSAGGGGLNGSVTITTSISADLPLNNINGSEGVNIPINGGTTVSAGGGGSQSMWHHTQLRNNGMTEGTTTLVGVGGSGIGGDGCVWQAGTPSSNWNGGVNNGSIIRYPTDGVANTGSGGGGWSYVKDPAIGSGGSGIIIIRVSEIVQEEPEPQSDNSEFKGYLIFNETVNLRGVPTTIFDVDSSNVTLNTNDKLFSRYFSIEERMVITYSVDLQLPKTFLL